MNDTQSQQAVSTRLGSEKPSEKASKIVEFSTMYRLKVSKDGCGDPIIKGKLYVGSHLEDTCHVFEGYTSGLGVYLNFKTKNRWNKARAALLAAGACLRQNGDMDGVFVFDPESKHASLVLRLIRARQKRVLSDEQRRALTDRIAVARSTRGTTS